MSETQVRDPLELIAETEEDLVVLSLKSKLIMLISKMIESKKLSQKEAAKIMGVTQPRVSNLTSGRLSLFSVDTLLVMAMKIGVDVKVTMDGNSSICMTALNTEGWEWTDVVYDQLNNQ